MDEKSSTITTKPATRRSTRQSLLNAKPVYDEEKNFEDIDVFETDTKVKKAKHQNILNGK
jgi:hypothetical protein